MLTHFIVLLKDKDNSKLNYVTKSTLFMGGGGYFHSKKNSFIEVLQVSHYYLFL